MTSGSGSRSVDEAQAATSRDAKAVGKDAKGACSDYIGIDDAGLGCTVVACEFDLRTKEWKKRRGAPRPGDGEGGLPDFTLTTFPSGPFRSLSTKGRHSREERESERRAQEILRTNSW